MKVIHVNYSGSQGGGAAIAALRLHRAMLYSKADLSSEYWCARSDSDPQTYCFQSSCMSFLGKVENNVIGKLLKKSVRSLNLFPTSLVARLNASDADVINLHWINGEMVSIAQLGRLKKPVVWTIHDMWAFCGAEHYTTSRRYIEAYSSRNLKENNSDAIRHLSSGVLAKGDAPRSLLPRVDIDRWTFRRKQRHWKNWRPYIVTPSRWLADCSRNSALLGHLLTCSIPNCIDLNMFRPINDKAALRREFNLPPDRKIILFGAVNPKIERKGGDLLLKALQRLQNPEKYALAVFGNNQGSRVASIDTCNVGSIREPEKMARLYNCADVMCVPSRQDNLPNTCVEAHACGMPIVAFRIGGISDIVDHRKSGYLAEPFNVDDYVRGLQWVLSREEVGRGCDDEIGYDHLCLNARQKAEETFAPNLVAEQYLKLYKQAVGRDVNAFQ